MAYYIASDRFGNYDLCHHGILGQKWGVRRYQNRDGSLTNAGKKRYKASLEKDFHEKNTKWIENNSATNLHDFYKNTGLVADKIQAEYGKSKEYNDYIKEYDKIRKVYADATLPNGRLDPSKFKEINAIRENNFLPAAEARGKKYLELCKKYNDEYLGAYLKDLGREDTAYGREVLDELLKKEDWFDLRHNPLYAYIGKSK